jgi:uncharacterized protein
VVEGQFDGVGVEDFDLGCIRGGLHLAAKDTGQEGDADVVAARVAVRLGVDADEARDLHGEARLLRGLAHGGLMHRLSYIHKTSWQRPLPLERFAATADQDNPLLRRDHHINHQLGCLRSCQGSYLLRVRRIERLRRVVAGCIMLVRDDSGNRSDRLLARRNPGISYGKGYALQRDRCIHLKILCISDRVELMLYGPNLTSYARGVEAVISCGDLPFDYLEYIVTFLGVPVYYVLGNHDPGPEGPEYPGGCTPLDGRVVEVEGGGLAIAGLSGSPLYSGGPNQYTERHMRRRARALSARIRCRGLVGRPRPRIFATHSPPFGLGDQEDVAHVGFESFVNLIDRHEPSLWLHGHIHLYGPDQERVRQKGDTKIVNVYGHRILDV